MTPKCIILDFDGTFTDVEREAAPFVDVYREAVFDLLGREDVAVWEERAAEIARNPGRYGWVHDGRIVAPAGADPYIRSTTIAQLLFEKHGILRGEATRAAVLTVLYHLAYEHTLTAFRPRAKEVLEALAASGLPTFVVTNARTDAALKKLRTLGPEGLSKIEVHGDARKYVVAEPETEDARFSAVPAEVRLPGLERPVYPRRGRYWETIARILQKTRVAPEEVIVCGDIYELDLALPLALGMQVHMVTGPRAPAAHEVALLESLGARASHGDDLGMILARVGLAG
ncbi:HAD family hydrolase [Polyangium sp. 15x6]|uniref:HAD family hydrolase n=1 Tax=Polyangium sp. 15x6 TaxID=3042687 RepID=UPI00249B88BD|nr:HAD family hydrolase [Polyangium sp. 15x6]MDI3284141.1 HAD family hydrolase [Polyangium sp. 15x6]